MIEARAKPTAHPRAIVLLAADHGQSLGENGAYAADAVAMNPLPPLGEEDIERLRALGYAG